jgi:hypothetical protein
VLATTKTYLLIIPTLCDNGETGFDHAMGKEKPVPSKLQISAKDRNKFGITAINFKPARLNNFNKATRCRKNQVNSTLQVRVPYRTMFRKGIY